MVMLFGIGADMVVQCLLHLYPTAFGFALAWRSGLQHRSRGRGEHGMAYHGISVYM